MTNDWEKIWKETIVPDRGNIPAFAWGVWGKSSKNSVSVVGGPAHLMNTSLERYRRANPLGDEPHWCWHVKLGPWRFPYPGWPAGNSQQLSVCLTAVTDQQLVARVMSTLQTVRGDRERERERTGVAQLVLCLATGWTAEGRSSSPHDFFLLHVHFFLFELLNNATLPTICTILLKEASC
jgi:hypothetical protein